MTLPTLLEGIKAMSVGALWRHVASISVVLGGLYTFAGPHVKSYADTALLEMLQKQGLSPEDFAKAQEIQIKQGKSIDEINVSLKKLEMELRDSKERQSVIESRTKDTYDLMKSLLPIIKTELAAP